MKPKIIDEKFVSRAQMCIQDYIETLSKYDTEEAESRIEDILVRIAEDDLCVIECLIRMAARDKFFELLAQ